MRVGFGLPVSGSWATAENLLEIAGAADRLGYDSLWSFQRLLAPPDGSLPPVYHSVLDPVVALSAAAAVTRRAELGIAVVNLPFLSPALFAKQLASLDVLCGGRAVAGLGIGWLESEFEASGVSLRERARRAEEFVPAVRALWGPDPVRFDGEVYHLPVCSAQPKPVRAGGIPLLLGGIVPAALERAGRLGDGWVSSSRVAPTELGEQVRAVRAAAERTGRDPDALRFVCRGVVLGGARTRPLTGPLDAVRQDVADLAGQGVTEVFADLNFDPVIGNPGADPAASMDRARAVLAALAPR